MSIKSEELDNLLHDFRWADRSGTNSDKYSSAYKKIISYIDRQIEIRDATLIVIAMRHAINAEKEGIPSVQSIINEANAEIEALSKPKN